MGCMHGFSGSSSWSASESDWGFDRGHVVVIERDARDVHLRVAAAQTGRAGRRSDDLRRGDVDRPRQRAFLNFVIAGGGPSSRGA
jgi:hypothetical protein